jgi:hypothetical protein
MHLKEKITSTIRTVVPDRRSKKLTTNILAFIIFYPFTVPTIKPIGNSFMNI